MDDPLAEARERLAEALDRFRVVAARAIDVAANPRAARADVDDARHQATFALAAVGASFKKALALARPSRSDD